MMISIKVELIFYYRIILSKKVPSKIGTFLLMQLIN